MVPMQRIFAWIGAAARRNRNETEGYDDHGDRRLKGGARVLRRPLALHDRDHRQLLVRQAIGLHVPQHRDREQSRRPHWPIGLLELAGEACRRDDIAGPPDAGAAALAMRDRFQLRRMPWRIRRILTWSPAIRYRMTYG